MTIFGLLFHEAAHLLLHQDKNIFIEENPWTTTATEKEEQEANSFAENTLIPVKFKSMLVQLNYSHKNIIKFAKKVGVSPGIIVGQLQHNKQVPIDWYNRLKRRYTWDSIKF